MSLDADYKYHDQQYPEKVTKEMVEKARAKYEKSNDLEDWLDWRNLNSAYQGTSRVFANMKFTL